MADPFQWHNQADNPERATAKVKLKRHLPKASAPHGRAPKKITQLKKIEGAILGCFDGLLTRMKREGEPGGTLLDHTMTLLGSNLGNAGAHDPRNNPILLAGGGLKHGGFIAYDGKDNTLLCNLFVPALQEIGVETDAFATSSSVLDW